MRGSKTRKFLATAMLDLLTEIGPDFCRTLHVRYETGVLGLQTGSPLLPEHRNFGRNAEGTEISEYLTETPKPYIAARKYQMAPNEALRPGRSDDAFIDLGCWLWRRPETRNVRNIRNKVRNKSYPKHTAVPQERIGRHGRVERKITTKRTQT